MPGGHPRPAHARDQRGERDEQERDVDRGRAERDQAADRGRVAGRAAGRGRRRRSSTTIAPIGDAAPVDPAQEARAGQHAVAGDRVDRARGERLGRHAAGEERGEHDRGERLRRPRAERRDDRGRHRVDVAARRRRRPGSGCASVDRDGVEDHQRADAQQRDPDRARDVARGALRLLRRADAGVEADEHPAADGERGEHARADRAARQRLGAERVRRGSRSPASRKTSSSASPIPTDATTSAAIPTLTARPSTSMPSAPTTAQTTTSTIPVDHDPRWASASIPSRVSAHGAPR